MPLMLELAEDNYYEQMAEAPAMVSPTIEVDYPADENPYIYIPALMSPTGEGMYVREDYFDHLPDEVWEQMIDTLEPYQDDFQTETMSAKTCGHNGRYFNGICNECHRGQWVMGPSGVEHCTGAIGGGARTASPRGGSALMGDCYPEGSLGLFGWGKKGRARKAARQARREARRELRMRRKEARISIKEAKGRGELPTFGGAIGGVISNLFGGDPEPTIYQEDPIVVGGGMRGQRFPGGRQPKSWFAKNWGYVAGGVVILGGTAYYINRRRKRQRR